MGNNMDNDPYGLDMTEGAEAEQASGGAGTRAGTRAAPALPALAEGGGKDRCADLDGPAEKENGEEEAPGDDIIGHLTELRSRIIRSVAAVFALFILFCYYSDTVMYVASFRMDAALRGEKLVFISPGEAFFVSLKLALFAAVLAALPYILYQAWKFVYVALTPPEKRYFNLVLVTSAMSFYAGLAFSVYVAIPVGMGFLIGYSSGMFRPMISVAAYYDFLIYTSIVFGVIFELPLVLLFLNWTGLVGARFLAANRKYAVLAIFILAGIFSPPDAFSQFLVAIPMLVLYEFGILLIRIAGRRN